MKKPISTEKYLALCDQYLAVSQARSRPVPPDLCAYFRILPGALERPFAFDPALFRAVVPTACAQTGCLNEELYARLQRIAENARTGSASVLLYGPKGFGKTHLVSALFAHIHSVARAQIFRIPAACIADDAEACIAQTLASVPADVLCVILITEAESLPDEAVLRKTAGRNGTLLICTSGQPDKIAPALAEAFDFRLRMRTPDADAIFAHLSKGEIFGKMLNVPEEQKESVIRRLAADASRSRMSYMDLARMTDIMWEQIIRNVRALPRADSPEILLGPDEVGQIITCSAFAARICAKSPDPFDLFESRYPH